MLRAARVGGSQQLRGHSRLPVYLGLGRSSCDRRVLRYDQRGAPLESFATLRPVSKAGYISANLSSQVLLPLFKSEPEIDEYWLISRRLAMERRWHCGHLQWRGVNVWRWTDTAGAAGTASPLSRFKDDPDNPRQCGERFHDCVRVTPTKPGLGAS